MVSSSDSTSRWREPIRGPISRAEMRSQVGMVGEVVVRARTPSPRRSWATLRTKVESTPPENATITEPSGRRIERRCASLCSSRFAAVSMDDGSSRLNSFGLKQIGGEVALAGIAENDDDDFVASEAACDLEGGAAIRT